MLAGVDLGDRLLEIGPGFGLATDVLCTRVPHVTAVEIDPDYAARLAARFADSNVRVVEGDATEMDFPDAAFTAAASFTMLHHVPTAELQDRLFAEVARVLAPGAAFIGSDSLDSPGFRAFHAGDTCVPVDPADLAARLSGCGVLAGAHHGGMDRRPRRDGRERRGLGHRLLRRPQERSRQAMNSRRSRCASIAATVPGSSVWSRSGSSTSSFSP